MKIIDISMELLSANVFSGDTAPSLTQKRSFEKDGFLLNDLVCCLHNGTHVDAPAHTRNGATAVGALLPEIFFGECVVCRAESAEANFCERMLFKGPPPDATTAASLAKRGLKLAGTESASIDGSNSLEVHFVFAESGVAVLENLLLEGVREGKYILCALPLKIAEAEASPVRAILIETD